MSAFIDGSVEAIAADRLARMSSIARGWGAIRPRLLVCMPIVLATATAILLVLMLRQDAANKTIQGLKSNHDIAVATDAPPEAVLARIEFLLKHDRVDEIQPYVESLDKTGSDQFRAIAHYNYANGRLRQAFDLITQDKLESAGSYVVLARQEYRRGLTLAPEDWDAKFNLDVASRLIRDFPAFERTSGDAVTIDRKKVWTDIPGTPEGLP